MLTPSASITPKKLAHFSCTKRCRKANEKAEITLKMVREETAGCWKCHCNCKDSLQMWNCWHGLWASSHFIFQPLKIISDCLERDDFKTVGDCGTDQAHDSGQRREARPETYQASRSESKSTFVQLTSRLNIPSTTTKCQSQGTAEHLQSQWTTTPKPTSLLQGGTMLTSWYTLHFPFYSACVINTGLMMRCFRSLKARSR